MKKYIYFLTLLFLPLISQAATAQTFIITFAEFLNIRVIPFLLGIAFLFFVVNAVRFFVVGSTNEDGREKAKALAIYSVSAFVVILTFWGIVNVLLSGIGFGDETMDCPDYIEEVDPTKCPS